uniref:Uncharacterized protein n=1 Tax=Anguilla anguilla TaxID=7936 RepID=A0A0E9QB64_ANGAN
MVQKNKVFSSTELVVRNSCFMLFCGAYGYSQ